MKKHHIIKYLVGFCMLAVISGSAYGQSLFKDYTDKSKEEIMAETTAMSEQIVQKFDQASMDKTQQKLYFYEYFSNFKKLILYAEKLAIYSDYEEDLSFAKENELFKGLPEKEAVKTTKDQTRLVDSKYTMMKTNIKDEIDTYQDLIKSSLDACEHLATYDLDPTAMAGKNQGRVQHFVNNSKAFARFKAKQGNLAKTWPGLETRISMQIKLWQEKGLAPNDPIIDIKITKAISNEESV